MHGTREDLSGAELAACLERHGFEVVERALTSHKHLAASARTILDVGANVGWYAVHLARATGAAAHANTHVQTTVATTTRRCDTDIGGSSPVHAAQGRRGGIV
mgnify:CR=1 FL=1